MICSIIGLEKRTSHFSFTVFVVSVINSSAFTDSVFTTIYYVSILISLELNFAVSQQSVLFLVLPIFVVYVPLLVSKKYIETNKGYPMLCN